MGISAVLRKIVGDRRSWRKYQDRVQALPAPYRTAVAAIERYLRYFGAIDGTSAVAIYGDVIDLFESAALTGTPIPDIVGADPADFVDDLVRNYDPGGYIARERLRLRAAMQAAAAMQSGAQ